MQWIDDELETEVNQVLEVCSEIRKMKSVQQILKKHGPKSKCSIFCMHKSGNSKLKNDYVNFFFFWFLSSGYLFSTDTKTLEILQKYKRTINALTFSLETIILPIKMDTFSEREKLILSSIVNEHSTVAISTDIKVQLIDIQERNRKKLAKLQENLKFMNDKISTEKYVKKAKPHTKQRDLLQVCIYLIFL